MASLLYGRTSHCFVFVCTESDHDQREWDEYLAFVRDHLAKGAPPRCLALTYGAGPSSSQRQQLNAVLDPYHETARAAVLTTSKVTMGIVTALSWFVPGFRAFYPAQFERAMTFLGVPASGVAAVLMVLGDLQRRLGLVVREDLQPKSQPSAPH
jgi:hypothetical protein